MRLDEIDTTDNTTDGLWEYTSRGWCWRRWWDGRLYWEES